MLRTVKPLRCGTLAVLMIGLGGSLGCPDTLPPVDGDNGDGSDGAPVFNNTTDRTNRGASYIGSRACMACHPEVALLHLVHGHSQKLKKIQNGAPSYPEAGVRAGVPDPPDGKQWSDVAFVIGGYIRKARFVDQQGFIMTDGVEGVNTQWNLDFPPSGTTADWAPYEPDRDPADPKPYDYSCFVCHTTGPMPQDPANPMFQDNRPGMAGTFAEESVQCEACHGPGSNHIPNPSARDNYVDINGIACKECHNRPFNSTDGVIRAGGGFIKHHEQWPELAASGGHAEFTCLICHYPHVSANYDRDNALRVWCRDCHPDQNMAIHSGRVLIRGDYTEVLSCESCHMPYASLSASAAAPDVVGVLARVGDMRTHIFRINADNVDYTAMFTDDLSAVRKDAEGRAAVTLDFVCLRCHNGVGNAFAMTVVAASVVGSGIHEIELP